MTDQEYENIWEETRATMREAGLGELDSQLLAQISEQLSAQQRLKTYLELFGSQIRLHSAEFHQKILGSFQEFLVLSDGGRVDGLELVFTETDRDRFDTPAPTMEIKADERFDDMNRELYAILQQIDRDQEIRPDDRELGDPGVEI